MEVIEDMDVIELIKTSPLHMGNSREIRIYRENGGIGKENGFSSNFYPRVRIIF